MTRCTFLMILLLSAGLLAHAMIPGRVAVGESEPEEESDGTEEVGFEPPTPGQEGEDVIEGTEGAETTQSGGAKDTKTTQDTADTQKTGDNAPATGKEAGMEDKEGQEDQEEDSLGSMLGDLFRELGKEVSKTVEEGGIKISMHGHYCGPGHGDVNYVQEPVDVIDAACKAHDYCYEYGHYQDCYCDAKLVSDIDKALKAPSVRGKLSQEAKQAGTAIRSWFALAGCSCLDAQTGKRVEQQAYDRDNLVSCSDPVAFKALHTGNMDGVDKDEL